MVIRLQSKGKAGRTVSTSKSLIYSCRHLEQLSAKQLPCSSANLHLGIPDLRCKQSTFWLTTYFNLPSFSKLTKACKQDVLHILIYSLINQDRLAEA